MKRAARVLRTCRKFEASWASGKIIVAALAAAFAIGKTSAAAGTVVARIAAELAELAARAVRTYFRRQHTCQS